MYSDEREWRMEKEIEIHLRNYNSYIASIANLKKKLALMYPNVTTNYELKDDYSSVFTVRSTTENTALHRLESKEALDIHEQIAIYEFIVDSILTAVQELNETERQFVQLRYFERKSFNYVTNELHFSVRTMHRMRKRVLSRLSISLRNLKNMKIH